MPPVRRQYIGQRTRNASRVVNLRNNETEEERSQMLPVIPRLTASGEINACLKTSILWRYVKNLKLTTNERMALQSDINRLFF